MNCKNIFSNFHANILKNCWSRGFKLIASMCLMSLFISGRGAAIAQKSFDNTQQEKAKKKFPTYTVKRLKETMKIDGNWNKPQWRSVKALHLTHYMGQVPSFRPNVHVKMMYDEDNLYIIFKVTDQFVRSIIEEYNGPVSTDACVEFFFSPDTNLPERYFNLEINAGGTPLMAYHIYGQKEYPLFSAEELNKIEIFHSLPKKIDPEIARPVIWTIEYKLPIELLEKFTSVVRPKTGTVWRANFYKIASESSNPHYITWSKVEYPKPNFHLPQFFGLLQFQ